MRNLHYFITLCIVALTMQSCSSELEPEILTNKDSDTTISHMVVKFNDKIYDTDVVTIGDSVKYLNDTFAEIYYSKISNNPDIAVLMSSDDSNTTYIEYYTSERELLQNHNFLQLKGNSIEITNKMTRSDTIIVPHPNVGSILGFAELFDDKKFHDTMLVTGVSTDWSNTVARLKEFGFNDKASSIKVYNKMDPNTTYEIKYLIRNNIKETNYNPWNHKFEGGGVRPVLKSYHNSNYSGAVLYCIAPPTGSSDVHSDYNLKNIGWNDRISSLEWVLVYDFSLFNGNNPEIPAHKAC